MHGFLQLRTFLRSQMLGIFSSQLISFLGSESNRKQEVPRAWLSVPPLKTPETYLKCVCLLRRYVDLSLLKKNDYV